MQRNLVSLFLAAGLAGALSCPSIRAADNKECEARICRVDDFLSGDRCFDFDLRWLRKYALYPKEGAKENATVRHMIARIFREWMTKTLSPAVIPNADFIRQNLVLVDEGITVEPTGTKSKKADAAFLCYAVGDARYLVTQTEGMMRGRMVVFGFDLVPSGRRSVPRERVLKDNRLIWGCTWLQFRDCSCVLLNKVQNETAPSGVMKRQTLFHLGFWFEYNDKEVPSKRKKSPAEIAAIRLRSYLKNADADVRKEYEALAEDVIKRYAAAKDSNQKLLVMVEAERLLVEIGRIMAKRRRAKALKEQFAPERKP